MPGFPLAPLEAVASLQAMRFMFMRLTLPALAILTGCGDSGSKRKPVEAPPPAAQATPEMESHAREEKRLSGLIAKEPGNFETLIARAKIRLLLGDGQGTVSDFSAAAALDPEKGRKTKFQVCNRAIWHARELSMKERNTEALKIYDVLLTLYPESGMAYHDRGALKIDTKDYEGAIADLTQAIKHDEGNNSAGDSFSPRAKARRAKGDEAGAAADEALANSAFDSAK